MRYGHQAFCADNINPDNMWSTSYYMKECNKLRSKNNSITNLVTSSIIYPWEIREYEKVDIVKFKFTGRDEFPNLSTEIIKSYEQYLKGIDNIKNIEDVPINSFIEKLNGNPELELLRVKDVKNLLPNIEHFKKRGHLCSENCAESCNYCYKCAEKIEKFLKSKQEKTVKLTKPICVFN